MSHCPRFVLVEPEIASGEKQQGLEADLEKKGSFFELCPDNLLARGDEYSVGGVVNVAQS